MKIKGLQHVAIAVRSSEKFERLLQDKLGLTLTKRYGRNAKNVLKSVFGFADGSHLELIEPVSAEGNSCVGWLERNGESVYHIALEVEDIDGAVTELKSRGVRLLSDAPQPSSGGTRIVFINPEDTENIFIELVERV